MHIDLNAFFATAEELRDPSLVNKPLIVGSSAKRGVVSTASYAARKYGIHSGMPTYQALQLCPFAIIKPVDFPYYEMLSNSFFSYVKRYTKLIEVASIDECFADMSEAIQGKEDPEAFFKSLQDGLVNEIGLKCSIGVAPTKWLAKMASDMKKPMGITFLRRKDLEERLYPLPIEAFFGIGKKTSPKLRELGIKTVGDFALQAEKDDPSLVKLLGKSFFWAKEVVFGRGDDIVSPNIEEAKSLGRSVTFEDDTADYNEITSTLSSLCKDVASSALSSGLVGKTIMVQIKDPAFKTHDKSLTLTEATSSEEEIYKVALSLYEKNFLSQTIRLVGVSLQNLANPRDEEVQMSLWNYKDYEKMDKTKLLINELNRKLDKPVLMRGSEAKKNGSH